ncbi:MAG TPA: ATP-binding protein, partial [Magnetospirillum sp.]|nr:ATP-binding protein [Magnetospirillum sp.]
QAVRDSEMRLRKVAEQRQLALDAAKLGWWQCDPVSGTVQWDESFRTIFGLTTYIGSVDALLNDVHHPEDVPFLRAKIEAALDPIAPRPFSAEYRICRPEGQIRWIEAHGLAAFEGEGQLRRAVNFVGTVADISARRFAEEELRSAKAEAERSMLARSKFLAAASHDLRQPVQSLTLLLAALKPHATAQPVAKAVGLMENALDGLNGLLSSILDVSRLDAGVVMPQMSAVDIGAILSRLAKEYAMLAAGKGLRLRCVGRHAVVRTDPNLIERVLRNLIENAIRYTDVGGIVLGARIRSGLVHVEVVDSGIGMPADKVPDIFEEFFQVGNPARDRNKGLGLGLAIVHRIVGLLGAEIKVFSNEGRGSRFCVLLPLIAEAPIQPSHSEDMPAEGGSARVLVIEDDVTVRTGLELLLRGWGYVVVAVNSGEAALDACARANWQLDAVIADHRLGPGLSGTDTAKVIRSKAGWTIPILVVTGDTAPERIAEVHGSGFTLMHKPVTADALRTTLERLLH